MWCDTDSELDYTQCYERLIMFLLKLSSLLVRQQRASCAHCDRWSCSAVCQCVCLLRGCAVQNGWTDWNAGRSGESCAPKAHCCRWMSRSRHDFSQITLSSCLQLYTSTNYSICLLLGDREAMCQQLAKQQRSDHEQNTGAAAEPTSLYPDPNPQLHYHALS